MITVYFCTDRLSCIKIRYYYYYYYYYRSSVVVAIWPSVINCASTVRLDAGGEEVRKNVIELRSHLISHRILDNASFVAMASGAMMFPSEDPECVKIR